MMGREAGADRPGRIGRHRARVWTGVAAAFAAVVVAAIVVQTVAADREARSLVAARFEDRVAATADFVNAYGADLIVAVNRAVAVQFDDPLPDDADLRAVVEVTDLAGARVVDRRGEVVARAPEDFEPDIDAPLDPFDPAGEITNATDSGLWVTLPVPGSEGDLVFEGLLDVTSTPLFSFVETMLPLDGQQTALVDGRGLVVLTSDADVVGSIGETMPWLAETLEEGSGSATVAGESVHLVVREVGDSRWYVIGWVPESELFAPLDAQWWLPWLLPLVLAVIATVGVARLHTVLVDRERVTVAARFDQLTGLANRSELERHFERHRRRGGPLGVLMVDVDHFKRVNDEYGHQRGDEVLHDLADTIIRNVRPGDVPARWGGEEFVVLLPDASAEDTVDVAERVRAAVEQEVSVGGRPVTVSIGCASRGALSAGADGAESVTELVARADRAMYRAKIAGRNRVEVETETAV